MFITSQTYQIKFTLLGRSCCLKVCVLISDLMTAQFGINHSNGTLSMLYTLFNTFRLERECCWITYFHASLGNQKWEGVPQSYFILDRWLLKYSIKWIVKRLAIPIAWMMFKFAVTISMNLVCDSWVSIFFVCFGQSTSLLSQV